MRLPRLITWDIDGTLLRAGGMSGNAAHKRAVDHAVNRVYGVSVKVNDVPHAGCTDRGIIRSMCRRAQIPDVNIDASMPKALEEASTLIKQYLEPDLTHLVLPGVHNLLGELKRNHIHLALTTGNLEAAAWAKLSAAGIDHYFEGGAFGSDCEHRSDILRLAIKNAAAKPEETVHVGDALADVQAAREVGARGIGVLTGAFTRQQLETQSPILIMDDLSDTNAFMSAIQLP